MSGRGHGSERRVDPEARIQYHPLLYLEHSPRLADDRAAVEIEALPTTQGDTSAFQNTESRPSFVGTGAAGTACMQRKSIVGLASGIALALAAGCGGGGETSGHAGAGTGANGAACAAFHDESSIGSVTVVFRNDTPDPIYLPGTCSGFTYEIKPQSAPAGGELVYDTSCLQTCEDLQHGYPKDCGGCAEVTYRIQPGGTSSRVWDGTRLAGTPVMPDACWYMGKPELDSCSRITAMPAGDYTAGAIAFSGCEGECSCDAEGVCNGAATGAIAQASPAAFSLPGQSMVEVVFDACAFGCPGSP